MRRGLLVVAVAAAVVVLPASAQAAGFADSFAAPARQYQPKFRWWWPNALVDNGEIQAELDQMADAGLRRRRDRRRPPQRQAGARPGRSRLGHAGVAVGDPGGARAAKARGMTVDLTAGPSWPSAVPIDHARQRGRDQGAGVRARDRRGGHDLHRRAARARRSRRPRPRVTQQKLDLRPGREGHHRRRAAQDRLHARRLDASRTSRSPPTAPSAGRRPTTATGSLISYWERGSGQKPEGSAHTTPDSYVIDHFSQTGTKAITDYWDQHILTPEIRSLLKDAGGAFFEDSLELETDSALWTPGFAEAFQQQVGYSLLPVPAAGGQERREDRLQLHRLDAVGLASGATSTSSSPTSTTRTTSSR